MGVFLPPLDPSRPLVANRVFRFNGRIYRNREPFPHPDDPPASDRQIKLLYQGRGIGYADEDSVRAVPPRVPSVLPQAVDPTETPPPPPTEAPVISDEAKKLARNSTHDALFTKASGLAGVTKDQTKAQIAQALIDAGRAGDGTA